MPTGRTHRARPSSPRSPRATKRAARRPAVRRVSLPFAPWSRLRRTAVRAIGAVTGHGSLRARITLLTGGVALLLSATLSLAAVFAARRWAMEDAGREVARDAARTAAVLERAAAAPPPARPVLLRAALASAASVEGGGLFVLTRSGGALAAPPGTVLRRADTNRVDTRAMARLAALAPARGGAGGYTVTPWPLQTNGTPYVVGYATLRGPQGAVWTVLARRPAADALAPARALQTQALVVSLLAGLACAFAASRVAALLTEPARRMADAADRVRRGDRAAAAAFATPAPGLGPAGGDEVARLGGALGALVRALTRREEELEAANRRMREELSAHEQALAERARLMAEVQVASVRQRRLLRDLLRSVTEDKLRLCDTDADLPARLPHLAGDGPVPLARASLRVLRQAAGEAATAVSMEPERHADLLLGCGEAGMNAVVHAGGGVGTVYHDGAGRVQVWVSDRGKGIAEENIPRATLERGYTTAGTMGHGFPLILRTCDRVWLLTGANGTTVVLEQEREEPQMAWLRARGLDALNSGLLKS
jgi:anti-sigma regulatory factor (Ser/Thr protein kinase)/HAMP domain-containing protein